MLRKLYATVSGSCCADNPDSPQHQEVLLPGSLYGMIIKERMEEILNNIRSNIATDVRNGLAVDFNDSRQHRYIFFVHILITTFRAIFHESLIESQFRHWFKAGKLPRYWQSGLSNWS